MQTPINRISKQIDLLVIAIVCLACLAVIFYHLATLTHFPPVLIDEPWYSDVAWTWLNTGRNFDAMHTGGRDFAIWPYIGNLPLVISFYFFGPGLLQARIVSWVFGILLLVATALVGRRLYGTLTGLVSIMMLSISSPYLLSSHYYRPDIMLVAIAMFSFWLILIALEKNKWWAHFLAGALIIMAVDIHQNAVLFAVASGILYLFWYGKNILRTRGVWFFLLGGFVGVLYYMFVVVIPNQSDFIKFYSFTLGTTHQLPLLSFDPLTILKSARAEIGRYRFFENSVDFAAIVASIVYLTFRRKKEDRTLVVYTVTLLACFVLFVGNKEYLYTIYLYPFFMLMVAAALVSLIDIKGKNIPQSAFFITFLCMYLVSNSYYMVQQLSRHQEYDYYASVTMLQESIPDDARVMGMPQWWFGLNERDFRSINSLTFLHFLKGDSLTQALFEIRPDYIILDNDLRDRLVEEGYYKNEGFEVYKLPKREFEDFLGKYGEKVIEYFVPFHGRIDLYKIHWDGG
jgi:4-amino-4-deoxy-L-arabinose transferase-like glycosyltransferase